MDQRKQPLRLGHHYKNLASFTDLAAAYFRVYTVNRCTLGASGEMPDHEQYP
jgi:hypothetical protein